MLRPSHECAGTRFGAGPHRFSYIYTYIGRGEVRSGVAGVLIDQIFDKTLRVRGMLFFFSFHSRHQVLPLCFTF